MKSLEELDAKLFETDDGYAFPFVLKDPTPGGQNLGRIGWSIEPIFTTIEDGTANCTELIIGARQTRDERYRGKLFRLKCHSPRIMTYDIGGRGPRNFFAGIAHVEKCAEHGAILFVAYPPDGASRLMLSHLGSSISLSIWWE